VGAYHNSLYMGSVNTGTVRQYSLNGGFVRTFGSFIGAEGPVDGVFANIVDIACSVAGEVFVLDNTLKRVQVFSPEGNFLRRWDISGASWGLSGIAVHPRPF